MPVLRRSLLATVALAVWAFHGPPCLAADPLTPGAAAPDDAALCQGAIIVVEQRTALPRQLLSAISLIESGRAVAGRRVSAWPWTINVGGTGTFYETAEAAIAAAEALRGSGVRSFDVGCMQVNMLHHPTAFASLRDAFDPALNAAYAARFLGQLHAELGNWSLAVAAYHSRTTEAGADYQRKVVRAWPDAGSYGVVALAESVGTAARVVPPDDHTPEFTTRLREAAADHAALARRIVGSSLSVAQSLPRRGTLRLAQSSDGRSLTLRR